MHVHHTFMLDNVDELDIDLVEFVVSRLCFLDEASQLVRLNDLGELR